MAEVQAWKGRCVKSAHEIFRQKASYDEISFFCRSCPASLEASLTRAVLDEARSTYLNPAGTPTGGGGGGGGVDTTDSSVDNLASNNDIDLSSSNNSKGNNISKANHF